MQFGFKIWDQVSRKEYLRELYLYPTFASYISGLHAQYPTLQIDVCDCCFTQSPRYEQHSMLSFARLLIVKIYSVHALPAGGHHWAVRQINKWCQKDTNNTCSPNKQTKEKPCTFQPQSIQI